MRTLALLTTIFCTLQSNAQNVNIPDANFKAFLLSHAQINTNVDSEIQVSEATAFNGEINCLFLDISDLTGIEFFTEITKLDCRFNQITSLDLSQNTNLTELICTDNQLTSLNLPHSIDLWNLECAENELTSLDVSFNTGLLLLDCSDNQLASLDVSQNNQLGVLTCSDNELLCLNLKNVSLFSSLTALNNSNLTCIEVDNVFVATSQWVVGVSIDPQMFFSTNCINSCSVSLQEVSNTPKKLQKITDLMGRETPYKPNTALIYLYDNGTTERIFNMD